MKFNLFLVSVLSIAVLLISCSKLPLSDKKWYAQSGQKVFRMRWIKHLQPEHPNFMVPEMVEEHDRFNPIETSAAAFDTDKKRVFIGVAVGGLYCLDVNKGETVWRYTTDHPVGSTPKYDADRKRVYFGADDGVLYAVHARSGRLIWSVSTGSEIRRKIHLFDEVLYFANANNTVFAVAPENGEIIWQFSRPPMEGFTSAGYADVVVDKGNVFVAFSDGTITALDVVTGVKLWTSDTASEVVAKIEPGEVSLIDADATPVVSGKFIIAASVEGGLVGLDAQKGDTLWTRPDVTKITGLASGDGLVYAAKTEFGLVAVDPETGRTEWKSRFGRGLLQDPVIYKDVILVSDSESGLFALSNSDGRVLQQLDDRGGFFARPSGYAGYLMILGNRSTLYALSIH